ARPRPACRRGSPPRRSTGSRRRSSRRAGMRSPGPSRLSETPTQEGYHVLDAAVRRGVATIVRHAPVGDRLNVRDLLDHDVLVADRANGFAARYDEQGRAFDAVDLGAPFQAAHQADEARHPGRVILRHLVDEPGDQPLGYLVE